MSVKQFSGNIDPNDVAGALKAMAAEIDTLGGGAGTVVTAVANAAGQTYTAASMLNGLILRSGATAVSDTTATAALIVAAIPNCDAGTTFDLSVQNNNSGTLTIVAGTGVTLSGTTTIATGYTRRYIGKVTNAATPAVTLYGVSTAAV